MNNIFYINIHNRHKIYKTRQKFEILKNIQYTTIKSKNCYKDGNTGNIMIIISIIL